MIAYWNNGSIYRTYWKKMQPRNTTFRQSTTKEKRKKEVNKHLYKCLGVAQAARGNGSFYLSVRLPCFNFNVV